MRRAATNAHPYILPPCSWAWVSRVGTGMGPRASVGAPELLAGASDDIGAGRGVWGGGGRTSLPLGWNPCRLLDKKKYPKIRK